MQISLANHYFYSPHIDVDAVSAKFKNASQQGKQAAISDAMKWWEPIVDCIYGNKKKEALALVFDIVQAEKATEATDLTHAEKVDYRGTAEKAFLALNRYALPQYKFELFHNAVGELHFKIIDTVNNTHHLIPSTFSSFDSEQAAKHWKDMQASFTENRPAAISLLNQICNATDSFEKIDCFTQLTKLSVPGEQEKFKLNLTGGLTYSANISLIYNNKSTLGSMDMIPIQMEEIVKSLPGFPGTLSSTKAEVALPESERLCSLLASMPKNYFRENDQIKAAATKILAEMFRPNRTVQDDIRSCVKLSKLDHRFKNLFKVSFSKTEDGKPRISLTFAKIVKCVPVVEGEPRSKPVLENEPFRFAILENTTGLDLSELDLRGTSLNGWNLENANLTGTDLRGADIQGVQFRGAKIVAAKFDTSVLTSDILSDEQLDTLKDNNAATKFSGGFLRHMAARRGETPKAMVPLLRDSNGKSLGLYKVISERGRYAWAEAPPEKPSTSTAPKGTNKYVSGIGNELVRLSFRKPYMTGGSLHDPSKPHKLFDTFDGEILKFIKDNELDCIVPQFRINDTQFLSRNMGGQDLYKQATSRTYQFSYAHFERVASNLDTLHAAKIVHRDIKPANMVLNKGQVYLLDLDTMGHIGKFEDRANVRTNVTTVEYLHPALRHGFYNEYDGLSAGKMVDQYSFISSMISVYYQGRYSETGVFHPDDIDDFLGALHCDQKLKDEIKNFLLDPIKCPLPKDRRLAEFLCPPK